jgi:Sulfatase-modifying factor enzyme 1/Pentapeptide repeats (8 copies)
MAEGHFTADKMARVLAVANSVTSNFVELFRLSGLDPAKDCRFADWSGVSFVDCDLNGFDFTGARLWGCQFTDTTRLAGACFNQAELGGGGQEQMLINFSGRLYGRGYADLSVAGDWSEFLNSSLLRRPRKVRISDEHLAVGSIFRDAAFAPDLIILPAVRLLEQLTDIAMPSSPHFYFMPGTQFLNDRAKFSRSRRVDPNNRVMAGAIIEPLAVGVLPITFEQFQPFSSSRLRPGLWLQSANNEREQKTLSGEVAKSISQEVAVEYCAWLSVKTGQAYRLLTEVEHHHLHRDGKHSELRRQWFWDTGYSNAYGLNYHISPEEWTSVPDIVFNVGYSRRSGVRSGGGACFRVCRSLNV